MNRYIYYGYSFLVGIIGGLYAAIFNLDLLQSLLLLAGVSAVWVVSWLWVHEGKDK